ncbi:Proprotein convertase subtilisin/kexin type 7 [Rhizophlyctis rosea]|nr:Proprotein convertase subtilisin/kexin type 7 [Rhizophlyctis rosea]
MTTNDQVYPFVGLSSHFITHFHPQWNALPHNAHAAKRRQPLFFSHPLRPPIPHPLIRLLLTTILILLLIPTPTLATTPPPPQPQKTQWALQLQNPTTRTPLPPQEAQALIAQMGYRNLGPIGLLEGYWLVEVDLPSSDHDSPTEENGHRLVKRTPEEVEGELLDSAHVAWFEVQVARKRWKRDGSGGGETADAGERGGKEGEGGGGDGGMRRGSRNMKRDFIRFSDPLFRDQWHLYNDGINAPEEGNDINVEPVWSRGINGSGVTVAVVDDGVQYDHPDLAANWNREGSWDFNLRTNSPLPASRDDSHGTRCAGEVAAVPNDICGVGVAFGAKISGERLISENITDALEAQAFNYAPNINHIYSSSWGPPDTGVVDGPGKLAQAAMAQGVQSGRGGRGSIYVFASGNGGMNGDNCNFDGYANSVHTVAVGAVMSSGRLAPYSEECSAHLGVTYSGGGAADIVTTDVVGCAFDHSGTSAAAPIAAGIIALMLSARYEREWPNLGWRDIQYLIVKTAKKNDPTDSSWILNGASRPVSHKYGFGLMDAEKLVDASLSHTLLPSPPLQITKTSLNNIKIPTDGTGKGGDYVSDVVEIPTTDTQGLASVEHVTVHVRIRHPQRKVLTISLVSPSGTESILATPRKLDDDPDRAGFDWTFMSVRCWGEQPAGKWELRVHDGRRGTVDVYTGLKYETGEVLSWTLTVHGTCSESDVIGTETQRTCSHTIAVEIRRRNTFIVAGLVFGVGGIGLAICYVVYRRVKYGVEMTPLTPNFPVLRRMSHWRHGRGRNMMAPNDIETPFSGEFPGGSPYSAYPPSETPYSAYPPPTPSKPTFGVPFNKPTYGSASPERAGAFGAFKQQILRSFSTDTVGRSGGKGVYEMIGRSGGGGGGGGNNGGGGYESFREEDEDGVESPGPFRGRPREPGSTVTSTFPTLPPPQQQQQQHQRQPPPRAPTLSAPPLPNQSRRTASLRSLSASPIRTRSPPATLPQSSESAAAGSQPVSTTTDAAVPRLPPPPSASRTHSPSPMPQLPSIDTGAGRAGRTLSRSSSAGSLLKRSASTEALRESKEKL